MQQPTSEKPVAADKPKGVITSSPATCYASRFKHLKDEQTARHLKACAEMLTAAGVPEWVMNSDSDGVPANSTPARLHWYLARRKDVKPSEIDQALQRDMKKWLELVARHNVKLCDGPGETPKGK